LFDVTGQDRGAQPEAGRELMKSKIWVIDWSTESGDEGVDGYWTKKPTKTQVNNYIRENHPDDHEAGTFGHQIVELEAIS
jgi:hypothetical protein